MPGTPEELTTRTEISSGEAVSGSAVADGVGVGEAVFFGTPSCWSSRSAFQICFAESFHCTRFGSRG